MGRAWAVMLLWAVLGAPPASAGNGGGGGGRPAPAAASQAKKDRKLGVPVRKPKPPKPAVATPKAPAAAPAPRPSAPAHPTPVGQPRTRPPRPPDAPSRPVEPPASAGPGRPERPRVAPPEVRAATPDAVRTTARVTRPRVPVPQERLAGPPARPLNHSTDHRFARPDPYVIIAHPPHRPPVWRYRPYWTHWWVHPYWRWTHATVVVVPLGFATDPWGDLWVPPLRPGWVWVPGHWNGLWWVPGHWAPAGPVPAVWGGSWAYVPGWWMGTVYVEGYWRRATRPGWTWVDGYYLDDGSYVRGWWVPDAGPPRRDYVWEAGFFDGEHWVEGFWRPAVRTGYRWVSAWLDDAGVYHAGYWEPEVDRPGMVWVPGWFDGDGWIEGYWVPQAEYDAADPEDWQPDPGWDAKGDAQPPEDEPPVAIPVDGKGGTP
ncbi:MAG: hypothetical protein R3F59_15320 [Myxococcota bacterium]